MWNFGDNNSNTNTSTVKDAQHIYSAGGSYSVTLTATGPGGSNTMSLQIKLANAPVPNFSFTGQGIAPATVQFSNSSTDAIAYLWDFGDILSGSNDISNQPNPVHIFSKAGAYNVTLTAIGSGGSKTITKIVTITNPTKAKITAVKITDMPFLDPSCNCTWDLNSGPDVIFKLEDNGANILASGSALNNASAASLPISWSLSTPVEITNFNTVYSIKVYDQDSNDFPSSADDFIGGYSFAIATSTILGFPDKIILSSSSSKLKIELTVQWQ